MKKMFLAMLFSFFLLLPTAAWAASLENGDPIGEVLSTNIKAHIDAAWIPSYNINGTTVVMVNDLKSYGFDVEWNERSREVLVTRNPAKPVEPIPPRTGAANEPIGAVLSKVLFTDIAVYLDGRKVVSYNVNGSTAIHFSDLSLYGDVFWEPEKKEIDLGFRTPADPGALTLRRTADGEYVLTNHTDKQIFAARLMHFQINDYYRAAIAGGSFYAPGLEGSLDAEILLDGMIEYPFEDQRIHYNVIDPNQTIRVEAPFDPLDGGLAIESYIYYEGEQMVEANYLTYYYKEILASDRVADYYRNLERLSKAKAESAEPPRQPDPREAFRSQALDGPGYNELKADPTGHLGAPAYFSGRVLYASADGYGNAMLLIDISAFANDMIDMYNQYSDDPNWMHNVDSQILAVVAESDVDILVGDMIRVYGTVAEQVSVTDGYGISYAVPAVRLVEFERTNLRTDELQELMP